MQRYKDNALPAYRTSREYMSMVTMRQCAARFERFVCPTPGLHFIRHQDDSVFGWRTLIFEVLHDDRSLVLPG